MQIRKQQKPTTIKCNWRHKPRGFVYILFSRAHVVFPISTRGEFQGSKEFHARSAWLLINQTQRAWPALSRDFTCRSTCTLHIPLPWFTDLNSCYVVWALNIIYPYTGLSFWINCLCGFFLEDRLLRLDDRAYNYSKFPWLWTGVFIKIYNL